MQRYWTNGNIVAAVAFVSATLLPWLWVFDLADPWVLAAAGLVWLVIGTFAAVNAATWVKQKPKL